MATDPRFVERFHREAKIIATLRHPGIVQVYDLEDEDGVFYMVEVVAALAFSPDGRMALGRKRQDRHPLGCG